MKSIQSRLATGLFLSLFLIFLILWFIVSNNVQKLAENFITTRLEHDIESIIAAVSFNQSDKLILNERYLNAIYKRPFSGHYYTIQHNETVYRSRSLWDKNLITMTGNDKYIKSVQPGPENQLLITVTGQFQKQKNLVVITAAEDLTPIVTDIQKLKIYFTGFSIVILFTLLIIQIIVLRTGLKPLRKIEDELHKLEKGEIEKLSTNVPSELKSVVTEVNQLSQALYKRLKRSRNALSDLSHAIKKPLTLLQNFTDDKNGKIDEQSRNFLHNQIISIQDITDRILKRARVSGSSKLNVPFNINEDLSVLVKMISAMYPDKNIQPELKVPGTLEINIDREDMLELLGNLIDNAWKWAKSKIRISIKKNNLITIIIEDDGVGANLESINELSQRGVRLDETVNGYGFGLAISSDIIQDYQGNIDFSRSESLGGFKIKIEIPTTR